MKDINQVNHGGHIIKIWTTDNGSRIVYDVIAQSGKSIHWARSMSMAKQFIEERNKGEN